jgi:hypothetical protein
LLDPALVASAVERSLQPDPDDAESNIQLDNSLA